MQVSTVVLALAALSVPAWCETKEAILARMDANAPAFRSVECGYRQVQHTAIINDDSEETGTLKMLKAGGKVSALIELNKPDAKFHRLSDGKFETFLPKINTVQEYDIGRRKGLVEQFLLLGFGNSGKDLAKNYDVKAASEEQSDGQMTTKLELVPKSSKVLEYFSKVEVWIPAGTSYAVRQKVYEKSGDTRTFYYSNVKLNTPMAATAVALNLPAGVKREFPGK